MVALDYLRLIGLTAGTLLQLLLLVLVVGYRRPRALERMLFFVVLSLFLFFSGGLLELNAELYYSAPPAATVLFARALILAGLGSFPAFLVHLHAEYLRTGGERRRPVWHWAVIAMAYLPLAYLAPNAPALLLGSSAASRLWPGRAPLTVYVLWLSAALLGACGFQVAFARRAATPLARQFHRVLLACFVLLAALLLGNAALDPRFPEGLLRSESPLILLLLVLPSALLGYAILRYEALQFAEQRNLIYAVSAAFLALMYLAVVRRVGGWLEPILPPEATAAILLFVLVFLFEPLQRSVGRALHRTFRREVDRLQRITTEIQQEARRGELARLVKFAEGRIRDEFGLAQVTLQLDLVPATEATAPGGSGRRAVFALRKGEVEIGRLEAAPFGSAISGDTFAALEFLAEQLPALIELCRLIEEKLKLERELAERERLALVGQMAARITHNLKNPLGSMKTILQVLLENPELSPDVRNDCAQVVAEIDRLSNKLGQLLRFSKPAVREAGMAARVAVLATAEEVVGLLRHDADRRQVRLELLSDISETHLRGSEEALREVLSNLVVNAIEALPPGGKVSVRLSRRDAHLLLAVTDDGPGIPQELREKVFQPFFSTKSSGTGLGLAIVERRLAELGGSLSWESPLENGRGARFTLRLPVAE